MPDSQGPNKVVIHQTRRIFEQFFKIDEAELSYEKFDGSMTPVVKRLCFERGDSVAAVVFHRDLKRLLFLRQFRYPTYAKGPGWILELVAGMQEEGEDAVLALRREILEEIGYEIESIEPVAMFYVSPGGSSERIALFYVEVSNRGKVAEGGGLAAENEDVQTVAWSREELAEALANGQIQDAKTLAGVLWFQGRR
jgi:nudix-type nucleoside diphosphatase (YffH/AdpP family)